MSSFSSVVLDANVFISGSVASLHTLASSHFTTPSVLAEVRDSRALAALSTLSFEVRTRAPVDEDIAAVRDFAARTGDLRALSRTDVHLLALTRSLEREVNGSKFLRVVPPTVVTVAGAPRSVAETLLAARTADAGAAGAAEPSDGTATVSADGSAHVGELRGWGDGSDDEGEWAGPADPSQPPIVGTADAGAGAGAATVARVNVGLLTSDYAMQNVALQMGLQLLTHSGLAVTSVKSWVLKCDSCFSIFGMHGLRPEESIFCKKCGNATLNRLGVTLGPDGAPRYHYKRFRQINTRGNVYALPTPTGGRVHGAHAAEAPMLLRADQLLTGGWKERARLAARADRDALFDAGGETSAGGASSRGWGGTDWAAPAPPSAHAATGVEAGYGRRNPNAGNRRRK